MLHRTVGTVVTYYDDTLHQWMPAEVLDRGADAVLIIVGGEDDSHLRIQLLTGFISLHPARAATFAAKHEREIDGAKQYAQRRGDAAVPNDLLVQLQGCRAKLKDYADDRD